MTLSRLTVTRTLGVTAIALWLVVTAARILAVQSSPRLVLQLQDYAALPITADNTDQNTRGQLARALFALRTVDPLLVRAADDSIGGHDRLRANRSTN